MASKLASNGLSHLLLELPFQLDGSDLLAHSNWWSEFDKPSDEMTRMEQLRAVVLEDVPVIEVNKLIGLTSESMSHENRKSSLGQLLLLSVGKPSVTLGLLENGADPNAANSFGKTALMHAAQYNDFASAKHLLDAGADINAKTNDELGWTCPKLTWDGRTALLYAAEFADVKLISLLLESGADSLALTTEKVVDGEERAGFGFSEALTRNKTVELEDIELRVREKQ